MTQRRTKGEGGLTQTWHDESDRLAAWGTLDPTDACMCTDCVLSDDKKEPTR